MTSKRAKSIARTMAKGAGFAGKSAGNPYLPVAIGIDKGLRPFERQLSKILKANKAKLDEMTAKSMPVPHFEDFQPWKINGHGPSIPDHLPDDFT